MRTVHPETLKILRKKMGLSQEGLAEASKVSKKTIARIETRKGGKTRASTVDELAKALRVKPEKLGKEPDHEAMHNEELRIKYGWGVVNIRLDGETLIAYDLVAAQYGVHMLNVINAAPLLFTLLAEMSLAERRRRSQEVKLALEDFSPALVEFYSNTDKYLEDYITEYEDSTSFDVVMPALLDDLQRSGLNRRFDLFSYGMDGMFENYIEGNPFENFLKRLAKEVGSNNDALNPEEIEFDLNTYHSSTSLFATFRKNLTGRSRRADFALSRGYVRIHQIPKDLLGDDAEPERVKWLEAKVPDGDWDEYEKVKTVIDTLRSRMKGDGNV